MKLTVNPNRMELMRLRRRQSLAAKGHKLLKDKLEEISRRFQQLMRRLLALQKEVRRKWEKTYLAFALVRAQSSGTDLETLIPEGVLSVKARRERIFSLVVPSFEIEKSEVSAYDLLNTESELDIGLKRARELLKDMLEVAMLWKAAELLAHEIETTRRRVNALEHILIPSIEETINYIAGRLEEMERSHQVRLMRIKEIVRSH